MNSFGHYRNKLAKILSKKKYEHSIAVAETAYELAKVHQVEQELAYLGGLLHDYARELPNQKLAALGKVSGLVMDPVTQMSPEIWHGPVGAYLVKKELGLKEPSLLQSIALHTLGAPDMSDLDKIVFLADLIEPGRLFPGIEFLREKAFTDLDQGMLVAYEQSFRYLLSRKSLIHPIMIESRNQLLMRAEEEGR